MLKSIFFLALLAVTSSGAFLASAAPASALRYTYSTVYVNSVADFDDDDDDDDNWSPF